MNAKYVIVDSSGVEFPIVLPPEVEHRGATAFGRIVSAGWCDPAADWLAFGESTSLNVAARPEADTSLLQMYFGRLRRTGGS